MFFSAKKVCLCGFIKTECSNLDKEIRAMLLKGFYIYRV